MADVDAGKIADVRGGSISGAMKAALWLLSVDEQTAIEALALLTPNEILRLRRATETVTNRISPEQLSAIHQEFGKLLRDKPLRLRGSVDYLTRLTEAAVGEVKAHELLTESAPKADQALNAANVDGLAVLLVEEHPQVIAAVMTTLPPKQGKEVLQRLPEALQRDVVTRVARMNKVMQAPLLRAQQILSQNLSASVDHEQPVNGVRTAAMLLNQLDPEQANNILQTIASQAESLSNQLRQAMFTFEDLLKLDKRGIQTLLKEVNNDQLLLALKATSSELQEKIFGSISQRAAAMLRDDLQLMGPVRLSEVEKAQTDIVNIALKLRDENKLTIVGQSGDYV